MDNASLHVQAAVALRLLSERKKLVFQEYAERSKRLKKLMDGIVVGVGKSGPTLLEVVPTLSPEDRSLVTNPLKGL